MKRGMELVRMKWEQQGLLMKWEQQGLLMKLKLVR
jgi:hypothetical protein